MNMIHFIHYGTAMKLISEQLLVSSLQIVRSTTTKVAFNFISQKAIAEALVLYPVTHKRLIQS